MHNARELVKLRAISKGISGSIQMELVPQSARWIGHRFREVAVHIDRILQNSELPRIAFCVGDGDNGMSSGLRGYSLARELRKFQWRTIVIPKQLELSQRQRIVRTEKPGHHRFTEKPSPHELAQIFQRLYLCF